MKTPLEHLELALGGNMNIGTLRPKAFTEIMQDYAKHYHKEQLEKNVTMKTKQKILDRIQGIKDLKETTINRISINNPEFEKISDGYDIEIKTLEWVLK